MLVHRFKQNWKSCLLYFVWVFEKNEDQYACTSVFIIQALTNFSCKVNRVLNSLDSCGTDAVPLNKQKTERINHEEILLMHEYRLFQAFCFHGYFFLSHDMQLA